MLSTFKYFVCFFIIVTSSFSENISITIPMRDGTTLPCDLYFPKKKNQGEKSPCVLIRSPVGREAPFVLAYSKLAEKGYLVAIQETRSSLDKQGKTVPFIADAWGEEQDGYDTVEWLSKSAYTNGKIATAGMSALGITQYLLAPSAPSALQCQYIMHAGSNLYGHVVFSGGQFIKEQVEGWLKQYAKDTAVMSCLLNQPYYNDFWKQLNALEKADKVNVPAFHLGGWFDTFLNGTVESFLAIQEKGGEKAKGKQKLCIGPWGHFFPQETKLGDFDLPQQCFSPPVDFSLEKWLEIYLKEGGKGTDDIPAVTYFTMGPFDGTDSKGGRWKTSSIWPPEHKLTSLYLGLEKTMVWEQRNIKSVYTFKHNPYDPAPTVGGKNLFLASGPKDQKIVEQRDDVLVFTSDPLEEDMEVTGKLKAILWVMTDQEDTDFVVKLTDVYPDGKSILIAEGIYRLGSDASLLPLSNGPKKIEVDLSYTSMVFAKGHSLRTIICGASYPRYEKNHNVGISSSNYNKVSLANNGIVVAKEYPSQLLLPIVP